MPTRERRLAVEAAAKAGVKRHRGRPPKPKPPPIKRPVGRPETYKPEYVAQAAELCRMYGAIDTELAVFFGVGDFTIYRWKAKYPEFREATQLAKAAADARVTLSLYKRALGYDRDAVKIFMPAGAKKPVYAPYREHIPADTASMIFWLKNRQREHWKDRQDLNVRHELGQMSDQEIEDALVERLVERGLSAGRARALARAGPKDRPE